MVKCMLAKTKGLTPIFITDARRAPDPLAVARGLPAGAIIICRDYAHPDRAGLAGALRLGTRQRGQYLLVAGDASLARQVEADGVHLPEYLLRRAPVLDGFGLVSAACHSRAALQRAAAIGVDFALVSPVFPTVSHPGAAVLGVHRFARLIHKAPVPVVALGGMNERTVKQLRGLPLFGVAAIDGFAE